MRITDLFFKLIFLLCVVAGCSKSPDPAPVNPGGGNNPGNGNDPGNGNNPGGGNPGGGNNPGTGPGSNSVTIYKGVFEFGMYYDNTLRPDRIIIETATTPIKMDSTDAPNIIVEFHNLGTLSSYSIGTTRYVQPSLIINAITSSQMNNIGATDTTHTYIKRYKVDGSDLSAGVKAEYLILCSAPSGEGWISGRLFPGTEADFKAAMQNPASISNPQMQKWKPY